MSFSYISSKVDGSIVDLTSYILNKHQKSEVKKINDSVVFFKFQGPPPYVDLVTPNTSFKIIEVSQIKENDWNNDGLEILNKVEVDDSSPEERKVAEEKEKAIKQIDKLLLETILPNKAGLNGNDSFIYLTSSNYLYSFFVLSLLFMILMNYIV